MDLKQKISENLCLSEELNIIAITSCLKRCSVAIKYAGEIFEHNEDLDAPTYLASILQNLIKDNGINLHKIEGIITASGPGSFTGIRTAQSLTKAIALTLKIPAASVDYFDVIERLSESYELPGDSLKIFVIKSEKAQVYYRINSLFEENRGNPAKTPEIFEKNKKEGVADYEDLIEKINRGNIILVGEDILEISDKIPENRYIKVNHFRMASNFLRFFDRINERSVVTPLYLNQLNFRHSS